MIKIYHNPRCRKSREGLAIVENSGRPYEIVRYLDDPLSKAELRDILNKLNIKALDLVRKQEEIWKSEFKGKDLSEDALLDALIKYPKLIERPVVISGNKGVLGRPPENILQLLD